MRIITGTAKGQQIRAPKGVRLRPTSELTRSMMFSILESMDADWSLVLDIYAGTGSLGIEALSRGAGWVDFIEQDPKCCAAINENLSNTGFSDRACVYCMAAMKAVSYLKKQYGIVVMGPPYRDKAFLQLVEKLAVSTLVGRGSTIVAEHSYHLPLESKYGDFNLIKERKHGDTCISIYQ
ncbi:MAG: RsmD family RNA methyltransferase [Dehalococcoidia bacterium]